MSDDELELLVQLRNNNSEMYLFEVKLAEILDAINNLRIKNNELMQKICQEKSPLN